MLPLPLPLPTVHKVLVVLAVLIGDYSDVPVIVGVVGPVVVGIELLANAVVAA